MLEVGKIKKNIEVAKTICEMTLSVPEIAKQAKPGQFINLRLTGKLDPLLRRPISLHRIDPEAGTVTMLYMVVGKGTAMMSQMEPGETIDVLGLWETDGTVRCRESMRWSSEEELESPPYIRW